MILKIFKAVWFLSLLATLAVFMYVYASLPEQVRISVGANDLLLSREAIFYLVLAITALFNMMVFVFVRLYAKGADAFLTWFFGLIISTNLFFIILLGFINLYNSNERFDYERLGVLIYGSLGLVVLWTASWPVVVLVRKFLAQKPVLQK